MTDASNNQVERVYEERYCAFVDILGFQGLIDRLRDGVTNFEALRKLLTKIHNPLQATFYLENGSAFRAQSISDAVAMSSAVNAAGLGHLYHALIDLTYDLLHEGFFIRGAIVKGRLYHDDQMVFGEALVRAYLLERDVVRYPRIMIASEVIADLQNYLATAPNGFLSEKLQQANDGPYFLDTLKAFADDAYYATENIAKAKDDKDDEAIEEARWELSPLADVRDKIQQRFLEAVDDPRRFEKVQWFAAYWNRSVGRANAELIVQGPGTLPEPAVWG